MGIIVMKNDSLSVKIQGVMDADYSIEKKLDRILTKMLLAILNKSW